MLIYLSPHRTTPQWKRTRAPARTPADLSARATHAPARTPARAPTHLRPRAYTLAHARARVRPPRPENPPTKEDGGRGKFPSEGIYLIPPDIFCSTMVLCVPNEVVSCVYYNPLIPHEKIKLDTPAPILYHTPHEYTPDTFPS